MKFLVQKAKLLRASLFALFLFLLISTPLIAIVAEDDIKSAAESNIFWFDETAKKAGLIGETGQAPNIYQIIGFVVSIILGFVGVVFLVLIIAGGFIWMTAGGNEEKVAQGRKLLTESSISFAIVLAAFLLVNFVIRNILNII